MNKRVEVATTNKRQFVIDILELGALGASLPDTSGVFGGVMLRTSVEVDESVVVPTRASIRVIPVTKKDREAYAQEQAQKNVIPVHENTKTTKKTKSKE